MGLFNRFKAKTVEADTIKTAEEWFAKGTECAKADRHKEALKYYDKALKLDPECAYAWNSKAVALEKLGRDQEAFQAARKAAKITPRDVKVWETQARLAQKLPGGSMQAYEFIATAKAIRHCNTGEEFAKSADYKTALYWYDRALSLQPDDETVLLLKQQALEKLDTA